MNVYIIEYNHQCCDTIIGVKCCDIYGITNTINIIVGVKCCDIMIGVRCYNISILYIITNYL
jgi:hypothetical protein